MAAPRVCAQPGCGVLVDTGRCAAHRRQADAARGSRQARGYDTQHDRLRREWAPLVATGTVRCWRPECGRLIGPGQAWHLGHDDHDRTRYRGPEHDTCNLSAAGRSAHRR